MSMGLFGRHCDCRYRLERCKCMVQGTPILARVEITQSPKDELLKLSKEELVSMIRLGERRLQTSEDIRCGLVEALARALLEKLATLDSQH